MSNRFISVILDPGRFCPEYGVIDANKCILICRCTDARLADSVMKCLNLQWDEQCEQQTKLLQKEL